MAYEIDDETKNKLLQMCGLPRFDNSGFENRVPRHIEQMYVRVLRRLHQINGSLLSDEVLAVVVAMADVLKEMAPKGEVVAEPKDQGPPSITDLWVSKAIKANDAVVVTHGGTTKYGVILNMKKDRSQVLVRLDGDDTDRWIAAANVTAHETVEA